MITSIQSTHVNMIGNPFIQSNPLSSPFSDAMTGLWTATFAQQNTQRDEFSSDAFNTYGFLKKGICPLNTESCWPETDHPAWEFIRLSNYRCPKGIYKYSSQRELEAMDIWMRQDVQNSFFNDQRCPYGSPNFKPTDQRTLSFKMGDSPKLLESMKNLLLNFKFHKELEEGGYSRNFIVDLALLGKLDFSQTPLSSTDSVMVKLLKSLPGVRLAKPGDKDITLVLKATSYSDHNLAQDIIKIFDTTQKFWVDISQQFPIHFEEVSCIREIYASARKLKKIFSNIKILHLMGHGNETSIRMDIPKPGSSSDSLSFRSSDFKHLDKAVRKKAQEQYGRLPVFNIKNANGFTNHNSKLPVDSDGAIILSSCSTGLGELKNRYNLVNQLALHHPNVTVVGLKRDAGPKLKIVDLAQRKFSFYESKIKFHPKTFHEYEDEIEDVTYQATYTLKPIFPFDGLPPLYVNVLEGN